MRVPVMIFCLSLLIQSLMSQQIILLHDNWQMHSAENDTWYPATVPGTVHTDLMQAGIIPDPFYGTNEKNVQWVEEKDWEYQCSFQLSEEQLLSPHIQLVFEGLDTYGDVYVNDSMVITADNMFRKWQTDIKPIAKTGENTLRIYFHSAVNTAKTLAAKLPFTLPGDEKVFVRKAQYHFGWDWGPRLVTTGIWQKVYLQFSGPVRLTNVQVLTQNITTNVAEVNLETELYADNAEEIQLLLLDTEGNIVAQQNYLTRQGENMVTVPFNTRDPKLWWTHDLGNPYLYNYTLQIVQDADVLDEKEIQFGLRTITLITEPDSAGSTFYFLLNGKPVFMKGANFIPTDNFLHRTTDSSYLAQLMEVKNANMNMLRIWGGGIYEKDIFYSLCDSLGILVWQDFMFACAMYPGDNSFLQNVRKEVTYQVERLRHHPSIALWCGNNEIDEAWHNWGWQAQYKFNASAEDSIWNWYTTVFNQMIPEILSNADTTRSYWPSSPAIGWGHKESLRSGDVHYWGVWWGNQSFDYYNIKVGRFMSEYGFQGMPSFRSFKRFTPADELKYNSPTLRMHQKHPVGYETILTYLQRDYSGSNNFENYIYLSQLLQARGISTAMEAHRRNMPYCMGTLYWQMNDCWPVTSWSAIDHYGNRKALYYASRKIFSPVITSVLQNKNALDCYIIADGKQQNNPQAIVEIIQTDDNLLSSDTILIPAITDTTFIFYTIRENIFTAKTKKVLRIRLMQNNKMVYEYFYYLVAPKELQLKKPDLEISYDPGKQMITLNTNVFAAGVYLYTENSELKLSDNYFDLAPGEPKYVFLEQETEISKKDILFKTLNTIH